MKSLSISILFSSLLLAQDFAPGVKIGGLLTDPAERLDDSKRYVVGPAIEVGLPAGFAAEASLLYNRFGSSLAVTSPFTVRGHSFELPILGKYYFGGRDAAVRPFAASGFSLRKIWFDNDRDRFGARFRQGLDDSSDLDVGAVVGGGAAYKAWRLTLAPEIRYTRWGGNSYPATNRNEVQVLLGIHF